MLFNPRAIHFVISVELLSMMVAFAGVCGPLIAARAIERFSANDPATGRRTIAYAWIAFAAVELIGIVGLLGAGLLRWHWSPAMSSALQTTLLARGLWLVLAAAMHFRFLQRYSTADLEDPEVVPVWTAMRNFRPWLDATRVLCALWILHTIIVWL